MIAEGERRGDRDCLDRSVNRNRLAAEALGRLVAGGHQQVRPVEAEILVIVDAHTLATGQIHDHSVCETGDGLDLPLASVTRLFCSGRVAPIIGGATAPCSTRAARSGTPTGRSAVHCGPCTAPARSTGARSGSHAARSITSTGSNTAVPPIWSTSCRSAPDITTSCTTSTGNSTSNPIAPSSSHGPTAANTPERAPMYRPVPDVSRRGLPIDHPAAELPQREARVRNTIAHHTPTAPARRGPTWRRYQSMPAIIARCSAVRNVSRSWRWASDRVERSTSWSRSGDSSPTWR